MIRKISFLFLLPQFFALFSCACLNALDSKAEVNELYGSLFEKYQPVYKDLNVFVSKQGTMAGRSTALDLNMKNLWQSYRESDSIYSRWLAKYGRVWAYDAALALYTSLAEKDYERAKLGVENFIMLIRAEKHKGYRGLLHFSYNTIEDDFIDPREPQGATQWVLKALYAYMLETGDLTYFNELTGYVRNDILPLQILDPQHPAYGLLRQGYMHQNGLSQGGYNIYDDVEQLNVLSHGVTMEHNADYIDFLRLITLVIDTYPEKLQRYTSNFRNELKMRHALCMQGSKNVRKKNYWPTAFGPYGDTNWSMAIDQYTWLAHTFIGVDGNDDIPWKSINIIYNEFTTEIDSITVLRGHNEVVVPLSKKVKGIFFFTWDFFDKFVSMKDSDRFKLEEMIQPEATAGGIIFLMDFIRTTDDQQKREFAVSFMNELLEGLAEIHKVYNQQPSYAGGGMPYATETIKDFFGPDPGLAGAATYQMALNKLFSNYRYFLGVKLPEGFENALSNEVDPQELPESIPVLKRPEENLSALADIPVDEIAEQVDIKDVKVEDGQAVVKVNYPEKYKGLLNLVILKKTDKWYVQPQNISGISAVHELPQTDKETKIATFSKTLSADNTMVILSTKNAKISPTGAYSNIDIEKFFSEGCFIKAKTGNNTVYMN